MGFFDSFVNNLIDSLEEAVDTVEHVADTLGEKLEGAVDTTERAADVVEKKLDGAVTKTENATGKAMDIIDRRASNK